LQYHQWEEGIVEVAFLLPRKRLFRSKEPINPLVGGKNFNKGRNIMKSEAVAFDVPRLIES
jgi:hypothetical protein